jgi:hypothetical protein
MKKIYFTFLAITSFTFLNAQLTQGNHAPVAGEIFVTYQCDSVGPGSAGANTNWDFSAVATRSSIVKSHSVLASTNPAYPTGTISIAASAAETSYFSSSASNLLYFGGNLKVGPVSATLNYTVPAVYASYPMSLNTTSTAAVSGSINITAPLPANGTFSGTSSVLVDGTGSVSIAGLTYSNITRVLLAQSFNFTTTLGSGSINSLLYQYYNSGTKSPVLSIETSTANTPLGIVTQTMVQRLSQSAPTNTVSIVEISKLTELQNSVNVFPNPANTEVNFATGNQSLISVSVFDITGKTIDVITLKNGKSKLDVSHFNQGFYFYRVTDEDGNSLNAGKFTVVH